MGSPLNKSDDLVPPEGMYEACRVAAKRIKYKGGLEWDWSELFAQAPDPGFEALVKGYLAIVLEKPEPLRGWKLPETTLVYPWIIKMFPEAKYILWYRDPRDNILGGHMTDDLADFGVPYGLNQVPSPTPLPEGEGMLKRAISWYYQWLLVKTTPAPAHSITVRFEDFVLKQEETLLRLEDFLGFRLARIPVKPERVAVWKSDPRHRDFDFLGEPLKELGYL